MPLSGVFRQITRETNGERSGKKCGVRLSARWEDAARRNVEIVEIMNFAIGVDYAKRRIRSHPGRACLMIPVCRLIDDLGRKPVTRIAVFQPS